MLVAHQVLEGEASLIGSLLDILGRDDRHHNLRVLSDIEIEARQFEDWSMGLIDSSKVLRPKVVSEISALPAAMDQAENDEHSLPLPDDDVWRASLVAAGGNAAWLRTVLTAEACVRGRRRIMSRCPQHFVWI